MNLTHSRLRSRTRVKKEQRALDGWTKMMLRARSAMNSWPLAALVFILVGGFFCTTTSEGLRTGSLTQTAAIVVLHLGLFLTLSASAFCFALAGEKVTRLSRSFFGVWVGLVVIAFLQFGWKCGAVGVVLYPVYAWIGRRVALLLAGGLILQLIDREHTRSKP